MVSSAAVVHRTSSPAQASMVAPFTGLKSASAFPVTRKANNDITSISSNGGRVQCMQVRTLVHFFSFSFVYFLKRSSSLSWKERKKNNIILYLFMQVWPTIGLKKFETLSYLPPLTAESLAKEVDYLLRNNWVPTLEFELGVIN